MSWPFSCPRHFTYKPRVFFGAVFLWISRVHAVQIKKRLYFMVFRTLPRVFHHLENHMANHGSHCIWVDSHHPGSVCISSSNIHNDSMSACKYVYVALILHDKYREAVCTTSIWRLSSFKCKVIHYKWCEHLAFYFNCSWFLIFFIVLKFCF